MIFTIHRKTSVDLRQFSTILRTVELVYIAVVRVFMLIFSPLFPSQSSSFQGSSSLYKPSCPRKLARNKHLMTSHMHMARKNYVLDAAGHKFAAVSRRTI